jgi:hypothetical protein
MWAFVSVHDALVNLDVLDPILDPNAQALAGTRHDSVTNEFRKPRKNLT